jgi:hypothetical protein
MSRMMPWEHFGRLQPEGMDPDTAPVTCQAIQAQSMEADEVFGYLVSLL